MSCGGCIFVLQRFAINSYTEYHETNKQTNSLVAGNRLQTDMVSTYSFFYYVPECIRSLTFPSKKQKYNTELTDCI